MDARFTGMVQHPFAGFLASDATLAHRGGRCLCAPVLGAEPALRPPGTRKLITTTTGTAAVAKTGSMPCHGPSSI